MLTRRDFLKTLSALFVSSLLPIRGTSPVFAKTMDEGLRGFVSVAKGKDKKKLVDAVLKPLGGMNAFVKAGDRVVIKPNAAWSRTPEEGANVHPDILQYTIELCYQSGAKKVSVVENSCDNYRSAFKVNGIQDAVSRTRASLEALDKGSDFVTVAVPQGKVLKKVAISKEIQEADVYINMPIAKSHGAATLTLGMKNHMGAIEDRWFFHRNDLHQCIADVSTVLRPSLTIIDATRLMLTKGPKGPGELRIEDKIIAGVDQVALDSFAATLFGYTGYEIGHIQAAFEHGLGEIDLDKMRIEEVEV
jgi:uncharacterized protein (DUF362 family)